MDYNRPGERESPSLSCLLASHAGNGILGVVIGALLIAWPPACSWILAVLFLGWAASEFRASLAEVDRAEAEGEGRGVGLPTGQRGDAAVGGLAGAGSPVDQSHLGRADAPRGIPRIPEGRDLRAPRQ
jgi:hypothetical protein